MSVRGCGALDDVMAELALGLLDGAARAKALAHIERCSDCQAEVAALTGAAEQLLLLAPEIPPAAGFETRVLDRIDLSPDGLLWGAPPVTQLEVRRRWWPRRVLLAVSAAAAMIVVIGALVSMVGRVRDNGSSVSTVSMFNGRGDVVGELALHHSEPAVLELDAGEWFERVRDRGNWPEGGWWMAVEDDAGQRTSYRLTIAGSSVVELTLDDSGEGGDAVPADDVTVVEILDESGRVWCTARFSS